MKTWGKHLEGYEVIEWNENNFDIDSHPFVKAAYKAKKWAYVSDYIRAYVIYKYGGIYLDTDKFQSLPVFKGASSMYDTLYKNMQSMMLGELTPEEVLKNTTEYYDSNLK